MKGLLVELDVECNTGCLIQDCVWTFCSIITQRENWSVKIVQILPIGSEEICRLPISVFTVEYPILPQLIVFHLLGVYLIDDVHPLTARHSCYEPAVNLERARCASRHKAYTVSVYTQPMINDARGASRVNIISNNYY